jgi:hypothetical protein
MRGRKYINPKAARRIGRQVVQQEKTPGYEGEDRSKHGKQTDFTDTKTLPVFCWCETKIVRVSEENIWHGITGSCGRKDCHGPNN